MGNLIRMEQRAEYRRKETDKYIEYMDERISWEKDYDLIIHRKPVNDNA